MGFPVAQDAAIFYVIFKADANKQNVFESLSNAMQTRQRKKKQISNDHLTQASFSI